MNLAREGTFGIFLKKNLQNLEHVATQEEGGGWGQIPSLIWASVTPFQPWGGNRGWGVMTGDGSGGRAVRVHTCWAVGVTTAMRGTAPPQPIPAEGAQRSGAEGEAGEGPAQPTR